MGLGSSRLWGLLLLYYPPTMDGILSDYILDYQRRWATVFFYYSFGADSMWDIGKD